MKTASSGSPSGYSGIGAGSTIKLNVGGGSCWIEIDCGPSEPAPFDKPREEDISKPGEMISESVTEQVMGYVPGGVDEDVLTVNVKELPTLTGPGTLEGEELAPSGKPVQPINTGLSSEPTLNVSVV